MKKSLFLLSIFALALMTSCKTTPTPEQLSCNPNPLTVVGNAITAEITGTFPEKKFIRKGVLEVTPVLKFNGKEVLGETVTYVGEKAKVNGKVVFGYRTLLVFFQENDILKQFAIELFLKYKKRKMEEKMTSRLLLLGGIAIFLWNSSATGKEKGAKAPPPALRQTLLKPPPPMTTPRKARYRRKAGKPARDAKRFRF